jgi:hypothetical protein
MPTPETKVEPADYEPPKLLILGAAEDLTQTKLGSGADAQSAFHMSL